MIKHCHVLVDIALKQLGRTYSDRCPLEHGRVHDKRHIVMHTNHKSTLKGSILVLWILFFGCLDLESAQGLDLEKLNPDQHIIRRCVSESRQRAQTFILATLVHQMSWRLRHEGHHPHGQTEGRENLDADRNLPGRDGLAGTGAANIVGTVANLSKSASASPHSHSAVSFTQKLVIMPKVIASCWTATREPRISGGAWRMSDEKGS